VGTFIDSTAPQRDAEFQMRATIQETLGSMEHLTRANIWLEGLDSICCQVICETPVLYTLRPEAVSEVIFNLTVPAVQSLEKIEPAGIQILRRPEPQFYGNPHDWNTVVGEKVSWFLSEKGTWPTEPAASVTLSALRWTILPRMVLAVAILIKRILF
jgi:hypothetical protein